MKNLFIAVLLTVFGFMAYSNITMTAELAKANLELATYHRLDKEFRNCQEQDKRYVVFYISTSDWSIPRHVCQDKVLHNVGTTEY